MSPERRRFRSLGRRYTDRKWPRHLRDFWLLIITVIALFGVKAAVDGSDRANRAASDARAAVREVQQGRRVSQATTCAVVSAISLEGRRVISGGAVGLSGPFERFLEAHGYPPLSVREKAAQRAGRQYVRDISVRVEKVVGHRGDGLVRPDGTIDCQKLQDLAQVPGS